MARQTFLQRMRALLEPEKAAILDNELIQRGAGFAPLSHSHPLSQISDAGSAAAEDVEAFEAAGAVAVHEALSNPHPTYLTQTEADALYAPIVSDAAPAEITLDTSPHVITNTWGRLVEIHISGGLTVGLTRVTDSVSQALSYVAGGTTLLLRPDSTLTVTWLTKPTARVLLL